MPASVDRPVRAAAAGTTGGAGHDPSKVRLHVVTGKGGTGKTTVAAALALGLSRQGKRVLLVEVEGRQGISQTFDVPPLGHVETRIVHALADLRAADLPLGAIVVNQLRDPLLSDDDLAAVRAGRTDSLAEGLAADLSSVGVKAGPTVVNGLLADAREHADRLALEREQDAVLTEQGRLTVRL